MSDTTISHQVTQCRESDLATVGNSYYYIVAMSHHLISPTLTESSAGAPTMDACCGEEMMVDSYRLKCCEASSEIWSESASSSHLISFK